MTLGSLMAAVKDGLRYGRSRLERLVYAGDRYVCNVCGASAQHWLKRRENGRCPTCRCASRTRSLWWYLTSEVPDPQSLRILHFAPEQPLMRRMREWHSTTYHTCDYKNPQVDYQVDIQHLPFGDASYDLVLCSHVLEHIRDDRSAMRELARVCAPGGRVLVQVPVDPRGPTREDLSELDPEERLRRFGERDHFRTYGLDIVEPLAAAGFEATTFEVAQMIQEPERRRHGLSPEQIFVCRPLQ